MQDIEALTLFCNDSQQLLVDLFQVLYDHDDLNEVLKRVDNTMFSVKTMFHGAPFRTAGQCTTIQ